MKIACLKLYKNEISSVVLHPITSFPLKSLIQYGSIQYFECFHCLMDLLNSTKPYLLKAPICWVHRGKEAYDVLKNFFCSSVFFLDWCFKYSVFVLFFYKHRGFIVAQRMTNMLLCCNPSRH